MAPNTPMELEISTKAGKFAWCEVANPMLPHYCMGHPPFAAVACKEFWCWCWHQNRDTCQGHAPFTGPKADESMRQIAGQGRRAHSLGREPLVLGERTSQGTIAYDKPAVASTSSARSAPAVATAQFAAPSTPAQYKQAPDTRAQLKPKQEPKFHYKTDSVSQPREELRQLQAQVQPNSYATAAGSLPVGKASRHRRASKKEAAAIPSLMSVSTQARTPPTAQVPAQAPLPALSAEQIQLVISAVVAQMSAATSIAATAVTVAPTVTLATSTAAQVITPPETPPRSPTFISIPLADMEDLPADQEVTAEQEQELMDLVIDEGSEHH